jgi:hypothetical protein
MSPKLGAETNEPLSNEKRKEAFNRLFGNKKTIQNEAKTKKSKTYEEGTIMKGHYELKKKGDKYSVDMELNINNDIDDKVKRALIKSIIEELNKNFDEYEFFYEKKN